MVQVIVSVNNIMMLSNTADKPSPINAETKCPPIKGHVLPIGLLGTTKIIVIEAPIEAINKGVVGVT